MAVSSIKGCWYKFSARIRDYLDVVDSYYRPEDDDNNHHHHHHPEHQSGTIRGHICDRSAGVVCSHNSSNKDMTSSSKRHNHHNGTTSKHSSHRHHNGCIEQATKYHNHISRTQLTPGYSKRKTDLGQVYFVDPNGKTFWYDPSVPKELLNASLNLDSLVGRLSSTWEVRQNSKGNTYYVNHIKKTTQFTDPRLVAYKDFLMSILRHAQSSQAATSNSNATGDSISNRNYANTPPSPSTRQQTTSATINNDSQRPTSPLLPKQAQSKSKRELYDKISILRQELLKQQVIAHPCKIDINRKRIFEESFRVVSQMQPRDLKKRLLVKFRGEEGLDYGGVAREWFYLLSREILNPNHGLFQYTSGDIYNLQINPDSGVVYREHLSYLNFCGRVIGMAVFHGHFIEGHFTLPFYKMLLGKSINLGDIENVDPELYRSLCWILENDITNVIDTTFLVQHNAFGQLQEHELKVNGRNTVVTEENKHDYVSLYVNYRCRRGIEAQFEALQRGFHELIMPSLLENFDEHELELLVGGLSKINIEDWRLHTKLKNCTVETPLVRWFWDIVKSYSEDKRARLLQFVTGSPRVPIQGFKALQGVNSELRLFTIHLIKNACTDNLPKSHTCFNRIDLPPYENYEKLRDKLTQAIEETMGFSMQ